MLTRIAIYFVVFFSLWNTALVPGEKEPIEIADAKVIAQAGLTNWPVPVQTPEDVLIKQVVTSNLGFIHAFIASLSVIIVSELGDKTFFIAAIMAMRHARITVFLGAMTALTVMTILSALFGWAVTIIPRIYTYYVSTALFAIFGIKMLREGIRMSPTEGQEELEEVQSDLRRRDDEIAKESLTTEDTETGIIRTISPRRCAIPFLSRMYLQSLTLTFLAEWGDRSQLATIILAAREDVTGVTIGGVLGHGICTGLAVLGGRMIAQKISVRTVTILGGVVFLAFALTALLFDPNV